MNLIRIDNMDGKTLCYFPIMAIISLMPFGEDTTRMVFKSSYRNNDAILHGNHEYIAHNLSIKSQGVKFFSLIRWWKT